MNWKKLKISTLILMVILVLGVMAFPMISSNMPTATNEGDSSSILTKVPTADKTVPAGGDVSNAASKTEEIVVTQPPTAPPRQATLPERGNAYYDLENVVLYLDAYGELPPNYITKKEAQSLGWSGGSVDTFQKGAAIGGDRFGNYEQLLPKGNYTECDIDTKGKDRGAKRLVFSDDGHYYYTSNHYGTFDEYIIVDGNVVKQ